MNHSKRVKQRYTNGVSCKEIIKKQMEAKLSSSTEATHISNEEWPITSAHGDLIGFVKLDQAQDGSDNMPTELYLRDRRFTLVPKFKRD